MRRVSFSMLTLSIKNKADSLFLSALCFFSIASCGGSPDYDKSEILALLQQTYPSQQTTPTVEYQAEEDQWLFVYPPVANCLDCDFSGVIMDDKEVLKIFMVPHG